MKQSRIIVSGAILAAIACSLATARASVVVTISDPGTSTPALGSSNYSQLGVTGYVTETFDELPTGDNTGVLTSASSGMTFTPTTATDYADIASSPTGSGYDIIAADQYGGAGGTGNYMAVGSETGGTETNSVLITLPEEESYFGFWDSASDGGNVITLLDNGTVLTTLNAQQVIDVVNAQPDSSQYYGNPYDSGADSGEPFSFINFFGTSGTTFDQVLITETPGTAGFEYDNPSIADTYTSIGGTAVVTPEPGPMVSLSLGALLLGGLIVSRRRNLAKLS